MLNRILPILNSKLLQYIIEDLKMQLSNHLLQAPFGLFYFSGHECQSESKNAAFASLLQYLFKQSCIESYQHLREIQMSSVVSCNLIFHKLSALQRSVNLNLQQIISRKNHTPPCKTVLPLTKLLPFLSYIAFESFCVKQSRIVYVKKDLERQDQDAHVI